MQLETLGIPTVTVTSDAFETLGKSVAQPGSTTEVFAGGSEGF